MAEDYCELCDLPLSQCVHGRPEPVPVPAEKAAPVRTRTPARVPGTPVKKAPPRKWTSPDELKAPIVALLQEHGGELPADEVFPALDELLGEALRPGDRDPSPTGEPRWQLAARKARRALQDEGVIEPGTPGVWRLR
ncbi:hypothetical protein [Nocardioides marmotae]|uniref:Restriction system protein Mrr-like N-terminal domain-containing protein n=1 Tax=Nocardioides marmotae TaxID=2663857 RepID=A0A6I3J7J4_9ACTN|nr:hypothetical protein [Nocardioides marmotae]MCR6030385.1 hypothetical protein [Gordonia jinghuaiqii]MBC9734517.1 hypothetical protein [Nocardioides marmotae]MTB85617.1 hypothetical protein [Nocardioides marmotae]MTB94019.1 hypothetical protein [Nocardioides marmotae]QKE00329.1 hypothetical protein HPC71_03970 [Nocardioides marmotae]